MLARATADQVLHVYGRVPAPIPTESPVITTPQNGSVVHKASVLVEGTCPVITPHVVISLLVDNVFSGSAPCGDDNRFTLSVTVTPGSHTLIAQDYTITGDRGPDSAPVTFAYNPPTQETGGGQNAGGGVSQLGTEPNPPITSPLVVTIDEPFIVFGPATDAIWVGSITGGRLPYHAYINWGDGTANTYSLKQSGKQHFVHHYRSMTSHTILLRVTDPDGRGVTQDYAAVTPYVSPIASVAPTAPSNPFRGSMPFGIYGLYLILLAIFGYLWLRAHKRPYAYAPVRIRQPSVRVVVEKRRKSRKGSH
jgi:hypothetical protein